MMIAIREAMDLEPLSSSVLISESGRYEIRFNDMVYEGTGFINEIVCTGPTREFTMIEGVRIEGIRRPAELNITLICTDDFTLTELKPK